MAEASEAVVPEPPWAGSEVETLLGSLERQRAYLAWKCGGLDAASMQARLEPSAITLGGLLKHLAFMEDTNFSWPGRARTIAPWNSGDWGSDPDWEWHSAAEDSPEQLMAVWRGAVARSRLVVGEALAEGGLDHQARFLLPDGRSPSLRRQLIDMVEEYARHVGHADLLREAIDGLVGEDPRQA
ncbi:MAG: DinB family protein [Actinomycetota bacterium]|nr:DinB family protein [Actinomycetota bacterium]